MNRLAAAVLLAALSACAGCSVIGGEDRPARVVVEGIVVAGDTFKVEPLDRPADAGPAAALAIVRFEPESGRPVEVRAGADGRFRLGPIAGGGGRLVVSAEGRRGLCLGDPIHAAPAPPPDEGGLVTLRWRIVLPPLDPADAPA